MERTRDEMMQAAQDEMARIHEVLLKLEAEQLAAMERIDQIGNEPFETPEEEAEISRRVELADQLFGAIQEKIDEAENAFQRAQDEFDYYLTGADDDDDDEDSGESLSVWDAKDIWLSNGRDEDYTFGYTEDELRRAAREAEPVYEWSDEGETDYSEVDVRAVAVVVAVGLAVVGAVYGIKMAAPKLKALWINKVTPRLEERRNRNAPEVLEGGTAPGEGETLSE